MKVLKKIFIVVLVLLLNLKITEIYATTLLHDGIEITLNTNQQEYTQEQPIEVTVELTNTNEYAIEKVKLECVLPKELGILEGQEIKKQFDVILAGETVSLFSKCSLNYSKWKEY